MTKKEMTPDERRTKAATDLYEFIVAHPGKEETTPEMVLFYLAVLREITILHSDGDEINTADADYNRGYAAGIRAARRQVYVDTFADYCDDPGLLDAVEAALDVFMDTYAPITDREKIQLQTRAIMDGVMENIPRVDPKTHQPIIHTRATTTALFGMMNDKVTHTALSGRHKAKELDGQLRYEWKTDKGGSDQGRVAIVTSSTYKGQKVLTSQKINADDYAVLTAVCNKFMDAWLVGLKPPYFFTEDELWRRLHGITDPSRHPTDAQRKAFNDSMYKQRFTESYINFSDELKRRDVLLDDLAGYGYEKLTGGEFSGYRLPAERTTFTTEKGRTVTGYELYRLPFEFAYNMALGHVVLVDSDLLDVSDTIKHEGDHVTAFKLYLLQEIRRMYYHKSNKQHRDSNRILYDTIYRELGIPTPAERIDKNGKKYKNDASYAGAVKNEAKRDRDKIEALLLSFKDKGYIKFWEPVRKGRAYVGVDIILEPNNFDPAPKLTDGKQ